MERLEFREVVVDLTNVTIDEACRLADAIGFVLNDCSEQFEISRPSDAVDVGGILEDHLEMGFGRLASIEGPKGILKTIFVAMLEADKQRPSAVGWITSFRQDCVPPL